MKIQKYVFGTIEIVGCTVVLLVWLAVVTTPYAFPNWLIPIAIWLLLPLATVVMILTLTRYWTRISREILFILGLLLLTAGAAVAYALPEYFSWALALDVDYWLKVSAYTLPAICTEGAIFTLFIAFVDNGIRSRTMREQILLSVGFLVYATLTVAANFMVLGGSLSVDGHIMFSRIVSGFVLACVVVIFLVERRISNKNSIN